MHMHACAAFASARVQHGAPDSRARERYGTNPCWHEGFTCRVVRRCRFGAGGGLDFVADVHETRKSEKGRRFTFAVAPVELGGPHVLGEAVGLVPPRPVETCTVCAGWVLHRPLVH